MSISFSDGVVVSFETIAEKSTCGLIVPTPLRWGDLRVRLIATVRACVLYSEGLEFVKDLSLFLQECRHTNSMYIVPETNANRAVEKGRETAPPLG